jgi:hypothetical protein
MSKACQYATIDNKILARLKSDNVKYAHASYKKYYLDLKLWKRELGVGMSLL